VYKRQLDGYLQSSNGSKIDFVYYHITFPYSDDQLYQHNTSDSQAKNTFYGPHTSTPKAYFNGNLVSNSYSNWSSSLDDLVGKESIFDLNLSGTYQENNFTINAQVMMTGSSADNEFTINYVVVEDVDYNGRNGILSHKNVMRKIVNPEGDVFAINEGETKNLSATLDFNEEWNSQNLKVIVFIQNRSTKEVFQSATAEYSSFTITDVDNENILSDKFYLEQNYPNPFNPTTKINYSIPSVKDLEASNVKLVVYDILGKEVVTLIDKRQSPGEYSVVFNAKQV
jgi:hypothetical protein